MARTRSKFSRVLTGTGLIVFPGAVLERTVESVFPELPEPRIPGVVVWFQGEVVRVETVVVRGVDPDGNATKSFFFIFFCNVVPVGPTVAGRTKTLTYFH